MVKFHKPTVILSAALAVVFVTATVEVSILSVQNRELDSQVEVLENQVADCAEQSSLLRKGAFTFAEDVQDFLAAYPYAMLDVDDAVKYIDQANSIECGTDSKQS